MLDFVLDGCNSHLWRNVMEDLSGCNDDCEWEANTYRLRGIETILPAVFRASGSLILNSGKVVEVFGFKI